MRTPATLILSLLICIDCANIRTPTGGPTDKAPPKVLASNPTPNQTNFGSQTIEITFNESIKLNNPKEEIIISPSPGNEVEFRLKGKRVLITPKEPWKDNTTYSILFRDGIQDITENNSPPNFKLAFSTGPFIDSLALSGTVLHMLEATPQDKFTVAIYTADTFDIFKHAPNFFTKTDKRGNFKLDNLKEGRYRIYAFDDRNKNLKVESRAETFGFIGQHINLQHSIDTIGIGVSRLDSRKLRMSSARNVGTITRLRFSKYIVDYSLRSNPEITHAFGDNQTEVTLWNPETADSIQVQILATDSLYNQLDTAIYIKKTFVTPAAERFTYSLGEPLVNPDNARLITTIKMNKPIQKMQLDSLYLEIDSTNRVTFGQQDITYNQKRKEIVLSKELSKKMFGPNQDPQLRLIARPGFLHSIDKDTSRVISSGVVIYWPEENGTLSVQSITQQKNYLLQLIENGKRKVVVQVVNSPKLTAKNIPPGNYEVRVILDTNQNGKWDPGNFATNTEAEKVIYYHSADGTTILPIRANWEVGPLQFRF